MSFSILKIWLRLALRRWLRKLAGAAVVVGIIGGIITFAASYLDKVRVGNLEIVSKQLEKLYGPVYALAQANEITWHQFRDQYMFSRKGLPAWGAREAGATVYGPRFLGYRTSTNGRACWKKIPVFHFECLEPPLEPRPTEVTEWRTWMKHVFQPMNVRMEQAIVGNLHLVIGHDLPNSFLELVAHTEGYKAVMAAWKDTDAAAEGYTHGKKNVSVSNFPEQLLFCAKDGYELLKARQADLLLSPLAAFAGPLPPPCRCDPVAQKESEIKWTEATVVKFWPVVGRMLGRMAATLVGISDEPSKLQCVLPQDGVTTSPVTEH